MRLSLDSFSIPTSQTTLLIDATEAYRAPDQLPVFPGSFQKPGPWRSASLSVRTGYVKLEFAGVSYLRRKNGLRQGLCGLRRPHQAVESGTCITELSSYGEPWVVEHEQVVVRRGPSTSEAPLGVMLKASRFWHHGVRRVWTRVDKSSV